MLNLILGLGSNIGCLSLSLIKFFFMLVIVSPAKSLDFETPSITQEYSVPDFLDRSEKLVNGLKKLTKEKLGELMRISPALADLNHHRYQSWNKEFTTQNAKQALLAFTGEVYNGIDAQTFNLEDFQYAQNHLRILSGLYGVLKPLDLMKAYRLEMGTKYGINQAKNLYQFWGDEITNAINDAIKAQEDDILINLASNEYYKSVKPKMIAGKIITPTFKDFKNGEYKVVMTWAKKMRGVMTNYIIKQQISDYEQLKGFNANGYAFDESLSNEDNWVFVR